MRNRGILVLSALLLILPVSVLPIAGCEDAADSSAGPADAAASPGANGGFASTTTSGGEPSADSVRTEIGPITTVAIEYDLASMTIESWASHSHLIVAGMVTKKDPPRWNSGDGRPWKPRSGAQTAVVYQTFYVDPEETLKGTPQWGTPIAFRAVWWNSLSGEGPVDLGDRVLAFGYLNPDLYGGGAYQPEDAYWLISEKNSLWVKQRDGEMYVNCGVLRDEAERRLSLDELRSRILAEPGG